MRPAALMHPLATLALLAVGCSGSTTSSGPDSGTLASTGGSTAAACQPGDTSECVGPGACRGGQTCLPEGTWGSCDCGTSATGGASTGGAAPALGGTGTGGAAPALGGASVGGGLSFAGSGGSNGGGSGGANTGGSGTVACPGVPYSVGTGGSACAGTARAVEHPAVDMFIMLDRGRSMGTATANGASTRWTDVTAGMRAFVTDPGVLSQDIRVGIQFFSLTGGFSSSSGWP